MHDVETVFLCISPALTTNSNIFDLHVQCRIVLKFIFRVFLCVLFCYLVVICDLVHDVETVFILP